MGFKHFIFRLIGLKSVHEKHCTLTLHLLLKYRARTKGPIAALYYYDYDYILLLLLLFGCAVEETKIPSDFDVVRKNSEAKNGNVRASNAKHTAM